METKGLDLPINSLRESNHRFIEGAAGEGKFLAKASQKLK
jgi:hypothetical protein